MRNVTGQVPFCLNLLRMQLGWSRFEMIRHLGCNLTQFTEWTRQGFVPRDVFAKVGELVEKTGLYSLRLQSAPLAENALQAQKLGQIHTNRLV